ncbi:MAG: hypothetical protein ACJA0H_000298 [Francisellaceae bacterium]
MGNLVIKKVIYRGENYTFESPEFTTGINIIVGDNGSGKSTLTYFIEFCLGGKIQPFIDASKQKRDIQVYEEIVKDTNNYVQLSFCIDDKPFSTKRFIGKNEIFVQDETEIKVLPINRHEIHSPVIFSDWLLEKLDIKVFELELGSASWLVNFTDLYRLICCDQNSEPRKIYKNPADENFFNNSTVIRKAIFETMLGCESEKYNQKFNELSSALKNKKLCKTVYDNFINQHPDLLDEECTLDKKNSSVELLNNQLIKLESTRDNYQIEHEPAVENLTYLTQLQSSLTQFEIKVSELKIQIKNIGIEKANIKSLCNRHEAETKQIEKIIFTHEKLNLFALEVCPFCMTNIVKEEGQCVCGTIIDDQSYEKFVYDSSEYRDILAHKKRSHQAINLASESYDKEIISLTSELDDCEKKSNQIKRNLKSIIEKVVYTGNREKINEIDDQLLEVKSDILKIDNLIELLMEKSELETLKSNAEAKFTEKETSYNAIRKVFQKDNESIIKQFNKVYKVLMSHSSCNSELAEIDDEYMPYIDRGRYRERSTVVPIRLMYFFTLLCLGMSNDNVKSPRLLIIDTPEEAGIDTSNLKHNLALLEKAIALSKRDEENKIKEHQVILTTGEGKYPDSFEKYIMLRFNKDKDDFILKKRIVT